MIPCKPSTSSAPALTDSGRRWNQQRFREQLRGAHRGVKLGIRGHASFFVVFFVAILVLVAGVVLRCGLVEWCLLLGSIGMVLTTKLLFAALESLCQALDPAARQRARPCVEIAAGAVAVAEITGSLLAGMILLSHLVVLW